MTTPMACAVTPLTNLTQLRDGVLDLYYVLLRGHNLWSRVL